MSLAVLQGFLGWCTIINMAILLWWFVVFALAPDWIHRLHGRWFQIPRERFDTIHYVGMTVYKSAVFLFNLVPYIALRIVS